MGIFRQFPYSNFHEMNMDEIIKLMKTLQEEWNATETEWNSLEEFVNSFFENLDISDEVSEKIIQLITSGEMTTILSPLVTSSINAWLEAHIEPTTPPIDDTLTVPGAGADAEVTGNKINALEVSQNDVITRGVEMAYNALYNGYYDQDLNRCVATGPLSRNRIMVFPVEYGKKYSLFRDYTDEFYYVVESPSADIFNASLNRVYNFSRNGWEGYYYEPTSVTVTHLIIACSLSSSTHDINTILNAFHICEGLYDFNRYYFTPNMIYKMRKYKMNLTGRDTMIDFENNLASSLYMFDDRFALPFPIEGQIPQTQPNNLTDTTQIKNNTYANIITRMDATGATSKTRIGYATNYDNNDDYAIYRYRYSRTIANARNYYGLTGKKILITCGVHGDEKGVPYNLCCLLEMLNNNTALDSIFNTCVVDIIPVVNIWGFNNESRYNARGVDLNRNFTYRWDSSTSEHKGTAPLSENESIAIHDLILAEDYDYIIDWHEASLSNGCYVATENIDFARLFFDVGRKLFTSMYKRYRTNPVQAGSDGQGIAEEAMIPALCNEDYAINNKNNGVIFEEAWGLTTSKWQSAFLSEGVEMFVNLVMNLVKMS